MVAAPGHAHGSTSAAVIALVIGMGVGAGDAQPVASLRQELYESDRATAGTGSMWQRWVAAGDRADARGRAQAVLALSVVITAVIVYAWFA
jgi:hypothetical protein